MLLGCPKDEHFSDFHSSCQLGLISFFIVSKFQIINLQFLIYYSDSLPRWMLALLPYPFLHGQYEGNHPYLSKMSHGVGQMQAVVSSDFKGSLDVDMQDS